MSMNTSKQFCTCKHTFQDKYYGNNIRVCNPTTKDTPTTRIVRCTVCNKEHTIKK